MSYVQVARRNGLVYKHVWKGTLLFTFLNPILYLGAIGFGIGALVSRRSPEAFGEGGYLAFFATGMLASTCMNAASFESSWSILQKFTRYGTYEAMLATPLQSKDVVLGELFWIGLRLTTVASAFFIVMVAFGVVGASSAVLAIPAAVFTGLGFSAAIMAYSATAESSNDLSGMQRFVIQPLFLFSGTFFPLDALPTWLNVLANVSPLYHGIELVRGVTLYGISAAEAAWHLACLLVFLAVSIFLAFRTFHRRLVK